MENLLVLGVIKLIKLYQSVSAALPPRCRFYPTCSQYGVESLQKYGLVKGLSKTIVRVSKCHPLTPGGYDPVE